MTTTDVPAAAPEELEAPAAPFRPLAVLLTAAVALGVALLPIASLPPKAHQTLVILIVAGGLWISEALPVAVTALVIPVLGIALGVTDLDAWVAKLRGEGVRFLERPYRLGETRAVMIEGPSREALELVEVS